MSKKGFSMPLEKIIIWIILLVFLAWLIIWYAFLGGKTNTFIEGIFG